LYPYFLAAGMFSMQPTVIPFELSFRWFVITMLMLMLVMFILQWLMKRWTFWRDQIALWMKLKEAEQHQEGASRSWDTEFEVDMSSDIPQHRGGVDLDRDAIELQSLGSSIRSSIGPVSPV
jgi:hypothetical protein